MTGSVSAGYTQDQHFVEFAIEIYRNIFCICYSLLIRLLFGFPSDLTNSTNLQILRRLENSTLASRCCDKSGEVTVESPTYDYYDQPEILELSDEVGKEEEDEGSQQPELGARVQVELRVGSFSSKTSTASCPMSPITIFLLLSTLRSSCYLFL